MGKIKTLVTDKAFWTSLAGVITEILLACNMSSGSAAQIATMITTAGVVIAYLINNGIRTAAEAKAEAQKEIAKLSR